MPFQILVVCTANICRSPLAERLLQARLPAYPPTSVHSAGTSGLDGHPMDEASARALRELGGDPTAHVARSLTHDKVTDAGLILTAASSHRAAILQADPRAMRKAFTLREFARLGSELGPLNESDTGDLTKRVARVAAQRGLATSPVEPGADEIADPFGAPWAEVRLSAATISDAVDGVIASLGLVTAAAG